LILRIYRYKNELEAFREFLIHNGMRVTPEREAILEEVFAEHEHFDVEGLIMRLRQKGKRSSRASVYRTLALLVESSLVQEVFYKDGHMHYEHIYGHEHHCHLRCLGCNKTIAILDEALADVIEGLGMEYNFEVISGRLEIFGFCPNCRDKNQ